MERISITANLPEASRICLGTWVMGGSFWGGTDDRDSIRAIHAAIDHGINIIDTAPVYGFGHAESIVGRALAESSQRHNVILATKTGLEWQDDGKVFRNTEPAFIRGEIEDSLRRLRTDYIDLYQVHWPDRCIKIEDTAATMNELLDAGKIRAVGVSNYSVEEMEAFRKICPIHTSQPPYNLFERAIDKDVLPYSNENGIVSLVYGSLCRGLLSGRMRADTKFENDDLRLIDPKFKEPRFGQYRAAVSAIDELGRKHYGKSVLHVAVRWILQRGKTIALWGARRAEQLDEVDAMFGWSISSSHMQEIDQILARCITDPVGPEFMSSPTRDQAGYRGKHRLAV